MTNVAAERAASFIEQKRELETGNAERNFIKRVIKDTMEFVEHIRELREAPLPPADEPMAEKETSTLIIAGRCTDGVVMIADRRSMRGTEYKEEKKLHKFYQVITAFAGLTGLKDKFLETVGGVLQSTRAMSLSEAIVGVEDTMALISERYSKRLGRDAHISALLAGLENLTSGKAKLYHVVGPGYAEELDFHCMGHGAPYATSLAQGLHQSTMSMEMMAEIGIFLVKWVENVDSTVGGIPDVVLLKDEEGITNMERAKVKQIHQNASEICEKLPKMIPEAIRNPNIVTAKMPKKRKK